MSHASERRLALYAGGELGPWSRWSVGRHVAGCARCRGEVQAVQAARERLRDARSDWPEELDWERLASEMKANIHVGLAAGECVGPVAPRMSRPRWQRAVILAPVVLPLVAVLLFVLDLMRPRPEGDTGAWVEGTVIAATSDGIELKQGDRMLSLQHPNVGEVNYLVNAQGTVRASYVDEETGQVTIHNVYAQ